MANHDPARPNRLALVAIVFAAAVVAGSGPAAAVPLALEPGGTGPMWDGTATAHTSLDPLESAPDPPLDLRSWKAHSGAGGPQNLAEALDRASAVARAQADLGADGGQAVPPAGHEQASIALLELADRHGVELTPAQREHLDELDRLPEPLSTRLTHVVDAFIALEAAHQKGEAADQGTAADATPSWTGDARPIEDTRSPAAFHSLPGRDLTGIGLDLPVVFETRAQLLSAIVDLAVVVPQTASGAECDTIVAPPAFAVATGPCGHTFVENVALSVDLGGPDTYRNNAGGSQIETLGADCVPADFDPSDQGTGVGTLVDLGRADDTYRPRPNCGVNGGGHGGGIGVLFDESGDDVYEAGSNGVNGGGDLGGSGLLLDGAGNDTYDGGGLGVNGGAHFSGTGFLYDGGGHDTYNGTRDGTNGGGWSFGAVGGLVDDGTGDDTYRGTENAVNGGGSLGAGLVWDRGGDDRYVATEQATNGGAYFPGSGLLLDREGDDTYVADGTGTNGGGFFGGRGTLLDRAGNDTYRATSDGANGGGSLGGHGTLLDEAGDDAYHATTDGANGGGATGGVGTLVDRRGSDEYHDALADCEDCSMVPKGLVGAQVDRDEGSP